jgi:hypothetical protein
MLRCRPRRAHRLWPHLGADRLQDLYLSLGRRSGVMSKADNLPYEKFTPSQSGTAAVFNLRKMRIAKVFDDTAQNIGNIVLATIIKHNL